MRLMLQYIMQAAHAAMPSTSMLVGGAGIRQAALIPAPQMGLCVCEAEVRISQAISSNVQRVF